MQDLENALKIKSSLLSVQDATERAVARTGRLVLADEYTCKAVIIFSIFVMTLLFEKN